jgi:hypothetical protein
VKDLDYAPLNSPQFNGNPRGPTPSLSDNDTSLATTEFVKGQNYITSSALTPYLTTADAATTYYPLTNPSGYVTSYNADFTYLAKANNLSDLTDFGAARTNLGLGTMATATASDYSTTTVANGLYYPLSSNPAGYLTSAPVTSVAGRTGAVTLSTSDISGLGTLATVNDAPSDGSTYGRNNGAWVVAGGGGGGGTDYQAFTTSGTHTWTKPAGAKWVEVLMIGGGGGGASGARQATTVARSGGNGATAGAYVQFRINASALGSTETVVVGAGGAGGASIATNSTNGSLGSNGGHSTFFGYSAAGGGNTNSGARAGYNQASAGLTGTTGGAASTAGGVSGAGIPSAVNTFPGTGAGGGGGAAASSTTSQAGGNGGLKNPFNANASSGRTSVVSGGSGGTTGGTAPTSGVSWDAIGQIPTGSGGGAYRSGQNGMAGANGASYGGAGGGGSASDNGFPSGAGGNGGAGAVFIITYC